MAKRKFSDAIAEYLEFSRSTGKRIGTVRTREVCLNQALKIIGNVYVDNIEQRHIVKVFTDASRTRSQATLVNNHTTLKTFFTWAARNKYIAGVDDPMVGYPRPKGERPERRRVHASKFGALLDSAKNPRDRMLIALGLYLLGRKTELTDIRIGDLDLQGREVRVYLPKIRKGDLMPISKELDRELRPYLIWYQEVCGPLDPNWFLIPGLSRPFYKGNLYVPGEWQPTRHPYDAARIVQFSLKAIGFPIRDENTGKSYGEGMHTLRRSMARAIFDECRKEGYDGALRHVQALLHHRTSKQTEEYIGLSYDVLARNEKVKGKLMLPSLAEVVTLDSRRVDDVEGIAS